MFWFQLHILFFLGLPILWFFFFNIIYMSILGFPGGSVAKNPPANAGDRFDPWSRKIFWRRKCQPCPVFLPGKPHGQRSLVGYSPWGHKESDNLATEQRSILCLINSHTTNLLDMYRYLFYLKCAYVMMVLISLWISWEFSYIFSVTYRFPLKKKLARYFWGHCKSQNFCVLGEEECWIIVLRQLL